MEPNKNKPANLIKKTIMVSLVLIIFYLLANVLVGGWELVVNDWFRIVLVGGFFLFLGIFVFPFLQKLDRYLKKRK